MSSFFGRCRYASVVFLMIVFAITVVAAAEESAPAGAEIDKPLPAECALLDDPEKRALMDGLLLKLAIMCDRSEFLGEVRQAPNMEIGAPDVGTDVPVNNPAGDSGSSTTQSETSLAVSGTTGTICSGFNDSYHGVVQGQGYTGFARSTDGGATFTDGLGLGSGNFGDPAMVWRKADGNFYLGTLGSSGLRIYRSTDDCQTFQLMGNIHNGTSDDKELMAVDNNPASPHYGNLYVVWTNFSSDSRIWATTSTDGGTTWGATQAISSSSSVQGAWPTVAPDGTVYASWVEFGSTTVSIRVSKSSNGGTTWSAAVAPAVNKVQPKDSAASGSCGRAALKGNIRYLPSPQIAVGPDNVVHVVYTYDPDGANTGDTVDVFYRRSTDGGASWETEILVNDDGTTRDQFFPTLSVGPTNAVSVAWYDRRDDPNNTLVDYYQRVSYDGGVTWEPSVRVSDVATPIYLDPNLAGCYHGDYDTQVQTDTSVLVQWSDDRRTYNSHNDPDVYLDTVPVCLLSILPPTASAGVGGNNLIQIGFNDSATPEITEYRVFRSFFSGGPYDLIATVPDSSPGAGGGLGYTYNDFDVSGGTEYFYVVRSSDGAACLSDPSNEVSAEATGACTLPPLFGGVGTVVNPGNNVCSLELGWSAATSRCGGGVTYNVYRSTTPGFNPGPLNFVAGGVAGTSYLDGGPLQSLVRHYYVVRAVDSVNGSEEENLEQASGVPTGPFSIGTWIDDAGDTGDAALTVEAPWTAAAAGGNTGPGVYLTGSYGNNVCADLTTPSMMLGAGSTLTFWSKYQIESGWDKGVVEISSDGGASWETVPVNYPGTSTRDSDACGLPTGSYFTGSSGGLTWTEYTASLAAWEGFDVMLRWRLSTDVSANGQGWWVDDIAITYVMVPSSCDSEPPLFADDFESGTTAAWSQVSP